MGIWDMTVNPVDAANIHNLILTVVGTAATVGLGVLISEKKQVPMKSMVYAAVGFTIAMGLGVYFISEHSTGGPTYAVSV